MRYGTNISATLVAIAWGTAVMGAEEKPASPAPPELIEATTQFTVDLFRAAASGGSGNVFASPLNVATALDMTALGARGETATQIAKVLHLPPDRAFGGIGELAATVRGVIKAADGDDANVSTANAGWFDEGETIRPEYIEAVRRSFGAEPHRVDFGRSPDAAREVINRWVAEQTREKIPDLLKPDHVRPGTSFVLTSAIYFKGYWQSPFDPKLTGDDTFQSPAGPVPAKMMNQPSGRLPYREDEEVQLVGLPYKEASLSMLVVLPRKPDGLADVEASLTAAKIQGWATNLSPTAVNLSLPRFQSTAEFELKDVLSALGMPDAFDPSKADFSGITGDRDVILSAVVHKAFVEVEEKGTEAAAATAVVGLRMSAIPRPPVVFRADRPFLYLIRDMTTGAILFIGRLARP